jgi:hypothetical protein
MRVLGVQRSALIIGPADAAARANLINNKHPRIAVLSKESPATFVEVTGPKVLHHVQDTSTRAGNANPF